MPTNFNLYNSVVTHCLDQDYSPVGYFTITGDTQFEDSTFLADHKGKLSYTVGNDYEINYSIICSDGGSPIDPSYGAIYIGGLSGVKPENVTVYTQATALATPVGSTTAVDPSATYVIVPVGASVITSITLEYASDASGVSYFNPPFFAVDSLADSITTGYSDGRKYQYNEPLRFQSTKTQNYPEKPASFPKKDFTLKHLSEAEQIECLNFFQRNQGKLVLMVEYGASDRHHYTLGFLDATTNTSQFYNIGEMGFSITQKHAVT